MKIKNLLILVISLLSSPYLFADSPLTSTKISKAYKDFEIVQKATKVNGVLNDELMEYLSNDKNPIDLKIALINELGWDFYGQYNSLLFYMYMKKNGMKDINDANADILICYAYLMAMDDYFYVDKAISYANKAKAKNDKSYTIQIITALIEAQKKLKNQKDWCDVYTLTNDVRENKSLLIDIKQEAIDEIFEYMDRYKKYCR